jgi:phosphatidylserine/phosphatidylglycerophosphate/cardiolipin synthase-like enzyme
MHKIERILHYSIYGLIFLCSGAGYLLLAQRAQPKPDPVSFAREILLPHGKEQIKQVLFTPDDDIKTVLIGLIESETESIRVAIFMFTEPDIAQALIDAHGRGVDVEVVADRSCAQTQWSKLQPLAQAGIPIYIWPQALEATRAIMHNKCIVFASTLGGHTVAWSGSYNFTKAASQINQENALIIEDPELVDAYQAHIEQLKKISELVGAAKLSFSASTKKRKLPRESACIVPA